MPNRVLPGSENPMNPDAVSTPPVVDDVRHNHEPAKTRSNMAAVAANRGESSDRIETSLHLLAQSDRAAFAEMLGSVSVDFFEVGVGLLTELDPSHERPHVSGRSPPRSAPASAS